MNDDITGWKFPPKFNKYTNTVDMVSKITSIRESLIVLLSTTPGERNMEQEYGCDLNKLAFKKLDLNTITYITDDIKDAIARWEKRIKVNKVIIQDDNDDIGIVHITIDYTILSTGENDVLRYDYSTDDI